MKQCGKDGNEWRIFVTCIQQLHLEMERETHLSPSPSGRGLGEGLATAFTTDIFVVEYHSLTTEHKKDRCGLQALIPGPSPSGRREKN
jgi:hypothetical protein